MAGPSEEGRSARPNHVTTMTKDPAICRTGRLNQWSLHAGLEAPSTVTPDMRAFFQGRARTAITARRARICRRS
jgi:hypothetical protein